MKERLIKSISESRFANGLPEDIINKLASIARLEKHKSGKYLFFQNQDATGFYLINSGMVKVFVIGNDGREQVIHLLEKGESIAEVAVFQGKHFPATALTMEDAELTFFPKNAFLNLCNKYPEILLNLVAILSLHLRHMVDMIDDLSLKDVETRLAKFLLKESQVNGSDKFKLSRSKGEMAGQIGTISATLSRKLKNLQSKGCICVTGSTVQILDIEMLENISNGELG